MSIHRHCDWCKKDIGFHAKVTVGDDSRHFCSYGHAKLWFEKEEIVYEITDQDHKYSYWAERNRIEREAAKDTA